jgi:hypothetical protein
MSTNQTTAKQLKLKRRKESLAKEEKALKKEALAKLKQRIKVYNARNPDEAINDLRRAYAVLLEEYTAKVEAQKKQKAEKKAAKKAAQICTSASSNDDTTDDSSVVGSFEDSSVDTASTTSTNPGLPKKIRLWTDPTFSDPSVKFTFPEREPQVYVEPYVNRSLNEEYSCEDNLHSEMPSVVLESVNSMKIEDDDDLVDGEQFFMDVANDHVLQAFRVSDSDDDDSDNLQSNMNLSELINGEG